MMRPAFSSTQQAAAFAVLLLLVLLSPVLAGKKLLPPREQAYACNSWGSGPYPWLRHEIFEETNDIDIAFVGSSHIMKGIDTPYVQAALSKKLGRPAVVRTIAWGGAGYDSLFLIAQDLLQHRKVRQLVFYDEYIPKGSVGNSLIACLFRFGDNASVLGGLPFTSKVLYYFASLIGMPRNLLGLVRPNIPAELFSGSPGYIEPADQMFSDAPNRLGAVASPHGFNSSAMFYDFTPFTPFIPLVTNQINASVYTASNQCKDFEFSKVPLAPVELHFARQFAMLARAHGCKLVMLHMPTLKPDWDDLQAPVIRERAFWPSVFSTNLVLVGIPICKLFPGFTDAEIKKLYEDSGHLNKNGMEFFTPLVTPALLQIYEDSANR